MRTGAAIFALLAGLAVLGLLIWTLVGMIRSASRRSREPLLPPPADADRGSQDGAGEKS